MNYVIGVYTHLSIGSSNDEFRKLLNEQLRPLLTLAFNNPDFRFVLRVSVHLVQWLETNYPEINMLIGDLCRKGQLELLGSPYYDSILSLIPSHERSVQLEKANTFFRKRFSRRPHGLWCIEQIFNTSLVGIMGLSSLEYMIISPYYQKTGQNMANRPFRMEELGKQTVIFPSDDRLSREIADLGRNGADASRFVSNTAKIISSSSGAVGTFMFNLDQMLSCNGSNQVFGSIVELTKKKTILPSEYMKDHGISLQYYLPSGVYGRDFDIGKAFNLNQYILTNNMLSRSLNCLNMLRDAAKGLKRNSDAKKLADHLFMKASFGMLLIPGMSARNDMRNALCRPLCELEAHLSQADLLPTVADLDLDNNEEYVSQNRNYICYINTRGAVISRLNVISMHTDLAMNSSPGFLQDFIRNGKTVELWSKTWEITPVDRKRQDFFAKSPVFEVNSTPLCITKHFKTRQNTIVVEYEVENLGSSPAEFVFETLINVSFPEYVDITEEVNETSSVAVIPETGNISFSVIMSEDFTMAMKNVVQEAQTLLGLHEFYQYTQIRLQKKLSIPSSEAFHFTVWLKTEKRRKTGDTV